MSVRLARLAAVACAVATAACSGASRDADSAGAASSALVDLDHSIVKRQAIGNCWLYATASWVESLHKTATGNELNTSESYWTYWHWFDQIVQGWNDKVQTGGSYTTALDLVDRFGVMNEGDFIPEESEVEMSRRQATALAAINLSLASGELSTREARQDRALVRRELDRAWQLGADVTAKLDTAFGEDASRTVIDGATLDGSGIRKAAEIEVKLVDPETKELTARTLADAMGESEGGSWWSGRRGALAWHQERYPSADQARRDLLKRVQRALHDRQPVILTFFVDFNALDREGRFAAPPVTPGSQGGHMVVMEDYQVTDVPGFGTLTAGTLETRRDALEAALSNEAKVEFFRVKNSWGSAREDRQFAVPGYHDLYLAYLNGPVKHCSQTPDGRTDTTNCWDDTPLDDVVLPAGY